MFTSITLTGTYEWPPGEPAIGIVEFQLTAAITDGSTVLEPVVNAVTLDGSGHFSIALPANDDSTTTPTGSGYTVTERIVGAPVRSYEIVLSHTDPGDTVDISTLAPALTTPYYEYVLSDQVGQPNGVASLDGTGKVPLSELPSGIGGGLSSFTSPGNTITIGGSLTNPTVDVNTIPHSKISDWSSATSGFLLGANNLSDLASASTARANLGLGSLATASSITHSSISDWASATSGFLTSLAGAALTANNLSDLANEATARSNLGLGSLATASSVAATGDATGSLPGALTLATVNSNTGSFGDAAHVAQVTLNGKGLATAASSVAIAVTHSAITDWSSATSGFLTSLAGAALTANNLSDLASASTARSNLGLGSIATLSSTVGGALSGTLPNPTLASFGPGAASYGSANSVPIITVSADGRVSAWTTKGNLPVFNPMDPHYGAVTETLANCEAGTPANLSANSTAFASALSDCLAAGGYFWWPPGNFFLDMDVVTFATTTNNLQMGCALWGTTLWVKSSSSTANKAFSIAMSQLGYWNGSSSFQMPPACSIDGLQIDGSFAPPGSTAIDYGPGVAGFFRVRIRNFTGYSSATPAAPSKGMVIRTGSGGSYTASGWCEDTVLAPGSFIQNCDVHLDVIADGSNSFQGSQLGRTYLRPLSSGQIGMRISGASHTITGATVSGGTITWTTSSNVFMATGTVIVVESATGGTNYGGTYTVTTGVLSGTSFQTGATNKAGATASGTCTGATYLTQATLYQSLVDLEWAGGVGSTTLGTISALTSGTPATSFTLTPSVSLTLYDGQHVLIQQTISGTKYQQLAVVAATDGSGAQAFVNGTAKTLNVQSFTPIASFTTAATAARAPVALLVGADSSDLSTIRGSHLRLTGEDGGLNTVGFHFRGAATFSGSYSIELGVSGGGPSPLVQAASGAFSGAGWFNATEMAGQSHLQVGSGTLVGAPAVQGGLLGPTIEGVLGITGGLIVGGPMFFQNFASSGTMFTLTTSQATGTLLDLNDGLTTSAAAIIGIRTGYGAATGNSISVASGMAGSPVTIFSVDKLAGNLYLGGTLTAAGGGFTVNSGGEITSALTLTSTLTVDGAVSFLQSGASAVSITGQLAMSSLIDLGGNVIQNMHAATGGTDAVNYAQAVGGDLSDAGGSTHYLEVSGISGNALNSSGARSALGLGSIATLSSTPSGDLTGAWPGSTVKSITGSIPNLYLGAATSSTSSNSVLAATDSGATASGNGYYLEVDAITSGTGFYVRSTSVTSGFISRIDAATSAFTGSALKISLGHSSGTYTGANFLECDINNGTALATIAATGLGSFTGVTMLGSGHLNLISGDYSAVGTSTSAAVIGKVPAGQSTTAQTGWLLIEAGGTTYRVPAWTNS